MASNIFPIRNKLHAGRHLSAVGGRIEAGNDLSLLAGSDLTVAARREVIERQTGPAIGGAAAGETNATGATGRRHYPQRPQRKRAAKNQL